MRINDSRIVQAAHEGIFEQPLWSTFLDLLREQTRTQYATLIFRPVGEASMLELSSGDRAPPHLQALVREKYAFDPLPYHSMREARVYALDELIDRNARYQAFRDEILLPWGKKDHRIVRVTEPTGTDAWLSLSSEREMSSSIGALLTALVPHLRIALRSFVTLQRERFRSQVTAEAFRKLNFGWLTLDTNCRIVDMAPHMEQFFERTRVMRRGRYGRLVPEAPAIDRAITALVKRFAHDASARASAINLSRDPMMNMVIAPIQERPLVSSSRPVAIAYVSGDRQSQADRCEQLVDLFGLLPSEARLAWPMAQGLSIREAAEQLGLTIETARNYSKKIYSKTGARGQAELVRNILTSVLAMA